MTLALDSSQATEAASRILQQDKANVGIQAMVAACGGNYQLLENSLWTLQTLRALANASGVQLDNIGTIVNLSRNGLADAQYQLWLQAQIMALSSGGQADTLLKIGALMLAGAWSIVEFPPAAFVITAPPPFALAVTGAAILSTARAGGVNGQMIYSLNPAATTFTFAPGDAEGGEGTPVATTYATPGTYNITIPANVATVRVQLWGGGGTGSSSSYGGGGGGGGYAESTFEGLDAGTIALVVGAAGAASTWNSTDVVANAGGNAANQTHGSGGSGTGTITHTGGSGKDGVSGGSGYGGGGGGSASSTGNGQAAVNQNGAPATGDGGPGGNGGFHPGGSGSSPVSGPGGGGGGGFGGGSYVGAAGYAGQAIITITPGATQGWGTDDQSEGGLWADVEQL